MFVQIATFLIENVIAFFVILLLVRFHFQWLQFMINKLAHFLPPEQRIGRQCKTHDLKCLGKNASRVACSALRAWAASIVSLA